MLKGIYLCLVIALLAGCGGGGGSTSAPTSVTLSAGQTLTLTDGETVLVPSGTVVTYPNGSQTTLVGNNIQMSVAPGVVLHAPDAATGPAHNLISAASPLPPPTTSKVALLAGSASSNLNPVDGVGSSAVFYGGGKIIVDSTGTLIVSDQGALRRVSPLGVVTTMTIGSDHQWNALAMDAAGNLFATASAGAYFSSSYSNDVVELDSSGRVSVLYSQWESGSSSVGYGGLAIDKAGNLFFADSVTNRVMKFAAGGGGISVLAGSGTAGNVDGTGAAASFRISANAGLAIDAQGRLYLLSEDALRMITPQGVATTIASKIPGIVSGGPLALDAAGNFYFGQSSIVYRLDAKGVLSTYATLGTSDFISSIAADSSGNLYVGTRGFGSQIFKISP